MSKKKIVLINLATIGIDCHRLSSIAIEFFWKAKTKCFYRRNTLKFNSYRITVVNIAGYIARPKLPAGKLPA